jgi:dipeptidase E
VGWSAGSNVACPTIKTTNDMPVVEPSSFAALNLIPFQINPHYTDANPAGHAGETREQRIEEFLEINRSVYVVGLREGTMLLCENEKLHLLGDKTARIFKNGTLPQELGKGDNLTFLLR